MQIWDKENCVVRFRKSHSIGKYETVVENDLFKCQVYWAKVIGSETESLFTQYTKHTFYEIQYALEGCIVMQIEKNKQLRVRQSEFIVIPPTPFTRSWMGIPLGRGLLWRFHSKLSIHAYMESPRNFPN